MAKHEALTLGLWVQNPLPEPINFMGTSKDIEKVLWEIYDECTSTETKIKLLQQWIEITKSHIDSWKPMQYDDLQESAEKFILKCKNKQSELLRKLN